MTVVTPTTPPRRRDAEANREAILSAAQRVIAHDPHASLDTIARAAGLSRRAVYGHFADRDALLRAVIEIGADRFNAIAEITVDADPRVALVRLAVRLWREASAVRASANIALDDAHVHDTVRALAPLRAHVREIVTAGVEGGFFRADMSPELLAMLVEETARSTMREHGVTTISDAESVVARMVLSIAGLSWREQQNLLADAGGIVD